MNPMFSLLGLPDPNKCKHEKTTNVYPRVGEPCKLCIVCGAVFPIPENERLKPNSVPIVKMDE